MKTVLVLGGYGFLGANLVKKLIQLSYNVVVIVKKTTDPFRLDEKVRRKIVTYYVEELEIEDIFSNHKIHTLVNTSVLYDNERTSKVFEANFIYPLKLIEVGKANGSTNFITFDSFFRKFSDYNQKRAYISSKAYFSDELRNTNDCRVFNLQLEHLYGPLDGDRKFVTSIATRLYENDPAIELTNGTQKRDFVFVNDVVDLVVELIEKSYLADLGYYHIEVGSGENISLKEFVLKMKEVFGNDRTILEFGKIRENPFEIRESSADLYTIPKWLAWRTTTSINEGLKEIFNSINYKGQ